MSHSRGAAAVLAPALLALTLGGSLLAARLWNPAPAPPARLLAGADVPASVGGYVSTGDRAPDAWTRLALPGARVLSRTYVQGGNQVDFLLVSGTSRAALHDPRLCLSGSLRLSDSHVVRLAGAGAEMQTYRAASRPGPPDTEVGYFYVWDGRVISSPTQIRAALLWSALAGRQSSPVYFIRFISPLGPAPRDAGRLDAFAARMWASVRDRLD